MVTIFIRRFVALDKEDSFLKKYREQKPIDNSAFKGEKLMRIDADPALPAELKGFSKPDCVTYLNIAEWDSWEAFAEQFREQLKKPFDPEFEVAPRERAVSEEVTL